MQHTDTIPESAWFEEQVVSLLPELLSAARSMAGSPADAEDLAAESVARAWERRDDLREKDRFRGWLFRILRNCFISRKRKRRARPEEVPMAEEGDGEPSFSLFEQLHQPILLWWGNPEKNFFNRLLKEDLQRAVEGLPERFHRVVVLADVHGFTYAEIADALEIPVNTVRSRLARGRARLQNELWNHAVERGLREPEPERHEVDSRGAPGADFPDTGADTRGAIE